MEAMWMVPVLAVIVEALTEYGKNLIQMKEKKTVLVQMGALAVSVFLCVASGADILAEAGLVFRVPFVGCILTGIFASRGANYASDLLKRMQKKTEREGV